MDAKLVLRFSALHSRLAPALLVVPVCLYALAVVLLAPLQLAGAIAGLGISWTA